MLNKWGLHCCASWVSPAQFGLAARENTVIGIPLGGIAYSMFIKNGIGKTAVIWRETWSHDNDIEKPAGTGFATVHGSVDHGQA